MKLVRFLENTGGRDVTVKLYLTQMPDAETPELWFHLLEGTYESEEDFDREWKERPTEEGAEFFFSLDILDARRLINAWVEEVQER